MNLVAKEYVACRYDDDGALVLSEFAGAADELRQAWLVNPYDINGMKAALLAGLPGRPDATGTRRMRAMRQTVKQHDVAAWARSFLDELAEARPPTASGCTPTREPAPAPERSAPGALDLRGARTPREPARVGARPAPARRLHGLDGLPAAVGRGG